MYYQAGDAKRLADEAEKLIEEDAEKGVFISSRTYGQLSGLLGQAGKLASSKEPNPFAVFSTCKDLSFVLDAAKSEFTAKEREDGVIGAAEKFLDSLIKEGHTLTRVAKGFLLMKKKQVLRDIRDGQAKDLHSYKLREGMLAPESQLKIYELLERKYKVWVPKDEKLRLATVQHYTIQCRG